MSLNTNDKKFGKAAVEEGVLSRDTLKNLMSRLQKRSREQDDPPSLKELLLRAEQLTQEEVERIERRLKPNPSNIELPGYDIEEKLGNGTTGTVYKAQQLRLDRPVAIKILHPSLANDSSYVDRFYEEIRTVGKLKHPGIVQGIDVGEEEGVIYYIMEYVDGPTLSGLIEQEGGVPEDQAIDVGHDIAAALSHADDNDLVHRDVKPENVIIEDGEKAKLCDLGLAGEVGEGNPGTEEGKVVGTPRYMSPEQASGENLDIRTDLYSLGATLYHAVTGEPPFDGEDVRDIMNQHIYTPLTSPVERNEDLSGRLSAVIEKLMEKDRADRYQSPDQVVEDFERLNNDEDPVHASYESASNVKMGVGVSDGLEQQGRPLWQKAVAAVFVIAGVSGLLLTFTGNLDHSKNDSTVAEETTDENGEKTPTEETGETGGETGESTVENTEKEENNRPPDRKLEKLKHEARNVNGSPSQVKKFLSRLKKLRKNTEDDQLSTRIDQFQGTFIKRQAKRYVERKIYLPAENEVEEASIEELVQFFDAIQDLPEIYSNTPSNETVNERKKQIVTLIKKRTRESNARMVGRIQHQLPDGQAEILRRFKYQPDDTDEVAAASGSAKQNDESTNDGDDSAADQGSVTLSLDTLPAKLQAEQADRTGAALRSDGSDYSGEGYVTYKKDGKPGQISWRFRLEDESEITYRLQFRYAMNREESCPMRAVVNENQVAEGSVQSTGGDHQWKTFSLRTELQEGSNSVSLKTPDLNGPNVDLMQIIPEGDIEAQASQTVSNGSQPEVSYDGPLEFKDVNVGNIAFALNFGGGTSKNGGILFSKDPFKEGDQKDPTGKKSKMSGNVKPDGFQMLFSHMRVGKRMSFTFPLANGTYDIRLYFIEPWFDNMGSRVFHVLLQDRVVLKNVDIFAETRQKKKGLTKTFSNIPVQNKRLNLKLRGRVQGGIADDAAIAAIAIKRSGKP